MKLTDRQRRRHQKDVEKHLGDEERKERKRAGNLRRALKKEKGTGRDPQVTEDNWEALLDGYGASKRRRPSLQEIAEELREAPFASAEEERAAAESAAIVISVASKRCRVFLEGRELDCLVPPHLAVRQKSLLAVGDRVIVEESEPGMFRIEAVLPRRSVLARPDPLNPHMQRLIAANIDVVIHVVSVKAPPLRPRLIDRFLIAIFRGEAQPVICVNKIDLFGEEERAVELAKLDPYRELGVPVIACSTRTGEGLDALRQQVIGKTSALVGHSGVGKSSILNALDERLQLATRTVHKRGTGRHTTTASTLYDFGDETYLIDTPGIREFGLWDLTTDALRNYFPELAEPSESCRFTNCTHVHEPDCEVKRRVEEGTLNRARYDTYVRLYDDLRSPDR